MSVEKQRVSETDNDQTMEFELMFPNSAVVLVRRPAKGYQAKTNMLSLLTLNL